jgi:ankyrin repeat protein
VNINNFTTNPRYGNYNDTNDIIDSIEFLTTKEQFSEKLSLYPNFKLDSGGRHDYTLLAVAAERGNMDIIDKIIEIGDASLLFIGNDYGESPLHCAIKNHQFNSHEIIKKLIKWGTPVDIRKNDDSETPLSMALMYTRVTVSSIFLRLGAAIPKKYIGSEVLESAKQKMMTETEKQFSMGMKGIMPKDVSDYILSISAKLI